MGQNKEPLSQVRRADFLRCKDSFLNLVAKSAKLSSHFFVADAQMVFDVFQEDDGGLNFGDDPCNMWPEVAGIVGAALLSGATERLARVACDNHVDTASPASSVESLNVGPNRSRMEGSVFHTRDQDLSGSNFDFHIASCDSLWTGKFESEVESSDAGAEGQDGELGMYSHTRVFERSFRQMRGRVQR